MSTSELLPLAISRCEIAEQGGRTGAHALRHGTKP